MSSKFRLTVGLPSLIYGRGSSFPDTGVSPGRWVVAQGANLLTRTPAGTGALVFRGLVEYAWDEHGVGIGALGQLVYDPRPDSWVWQNTVMNDIYGSRASSASSYQQHGGARGTKTPSRRFKNIDAIPPGSRVVKPRWKTTARHPHGGVKKGHHYCKKGWLLVRVGDTNMCWKAPR